MLKKGKELCFKIPVKPLSFTRTLFFSASVFNFLCQGAAGIIGGIEAMVAVNFMSGFEYIDCSKTMYFYFLHKVF